MALDDFVESEVAIAVAATAAIFSPKVRGVLRQGAVYGLAGVMVAGDAIGSFVSGVGRGVQQGVATAGTATPEGTTDIKGGAATMEKTPSTPEDAADALAAQAEGAETGEATATAARRTRRTRTEDEG